MDWKTKLGICSTILPIVSGCTFLLPHSGAAGSAGGSRSMWNSPRDLLPRFQDKKEIPNWAILAEGMESALWYRWAAEGGFNNGYERFTTNYQHGYKNQWKHHMMSDWDAIEFRRGIINELGSPMLNKKSLKYKNITETNAFDDPDRLWEAWFGAWRKNPAIKKRKLIDYESYNAKYRGDTRERINCEFPWVPGLVFNGYFSFLRGIQEKSKDERKFFFNNMVFWKNGYAINTIAGHSKQFSILGACDAPDGRELFQSVNPWKGQEGLVTTPYPEHWNALQTATFDDHGSVWYTAILDHNDFISDLPSKKRNKKDLPKIIAARHHQIGRVDQDGKYERFLLQGDIQQGMPGGICPGSDGAMWFTLRQSNAIGRITHDGKITTYPLPTPEADPRGICLGSDGAVWFTEFEASKIGRITMDGKITEYSTPTPDCWPCSIIKGPDGNIWFTEIWGSKIGRIKPDGRIDEMPVPWACYPHGITIANAGNAMSLGPGDELWFSGAGPGEFGRIDVALANRLMDEGFFKAATGRPFP